MTAWFDRLPIHRKLVALALAVTTAALVVATAGLMVLDLWRYRATASDDTQSLASVIAENTVAAVRFGDADAAAATLGTVRVRATIRRACVYLPDGRLFAEYRPAAARPCPASPPGELPFRRVAGVAPVTSNGQVIGTVYVERDLAEIWPRLAIAAATAFGMLGLASLLALALANRLHARVSAPIGQLAAAAREVQPDGSTPMPPIQAGADEVGDLVQAFGGMLDRVREANARLTESNATLRRQEAEREDLLRREREASRLKDEFLAAVSHELRTPLNAIAGWTQILTSTRPDEATTRKAVESIARNARAQARVIDDLVDVSRIVTGKVGLALAPIDLREVAGAAADTLRPAADARGVLLEVGVPGTACFVNGDRDRLQQVVWNLLSNAIKFTPAQGLVRLAVQPVPGAFELRVSDTGSGIAEAFVPHVFDRFRQADGSMTREHGGLGLGLAIVKELTELHSGTVSAASPGRGQGATFTVRLPALAGAPPATAREVRPPATMPDLTGISVLAVDDNVDALEVLAAALSLAGARVRVASGGQQALRAWDEEAADVLVCDLAMPVVDGFEVLRSLRARESGMRPVRAIALTAHSSPEYMARTRAAGFASHVSKPFSVEVLMRAIRSAVEQVS
ncbi:MAG: ATP-binding protein [Vicinamibacterales bacterium]